MSWLAWFLSWPNDSAGLSGSLGYLAVTGVIWHHLNCHEPGCWRPARHHMDGYCRRHRKAAG